MDPYETPYETTPAGSAIDWMPALITGAAACAGIAWVLASRRRERRAYSFCDKTVVISGGSRGLGLALARRLGAEGANLVLLARNGRQLDRAKAALEGEQGASVVTFECDVRDPQAVNAVIDRVVESAGSIDVLVNNAGIIQSEPFDRATADDFDNSLQTHFWGPYHLIQSVLPHMKRQREGRIVNISSIGGRISVPHLVPYSVGKFALAALSDGLNAELAGAGIIVTTVSPGLMRTGSHRNVVVRGEHKREASWFGLAASTPMTSMAADRAARIIVEACREGRARITPGWQARLAELANAVTPEVTAAIAAAVATWVLPGPGADAQGAEPRVSRDLDLGWAGALMPTGAAVRLNQT